MLINFTFRSWCSSQKSFGHCPNAFPSLSTYHKNQRDRIIFQSSRTNIRSRFQRWKASSFGHNVSKGSRQNSTVTLGKGVALERGELSGKRSLDWMGLLMERECWPQGWCFWAVGCSALFNLLLGEGWLHGCFFL